VTRRTELTKTHFQSGLACPKRLWWEVHESDAPELVPGAQAQWMFRQGQEVTVAAQPRIPGARYEVTLQHDRLHARVDILEPLGGDTHALIEVKGSNDVKPEHLWDVAFQKHVATIVGVDVVRTELMHLNRECAYPDLTALFIRKDISDEIDSLVAQVPAKVMLLLDVLEGPLPGDSRNPTCGDCPFYDRCWPQDPFSVSRFHRMKWKDKLDLERAGVTSFAGVPETKKLSSIQRRQQESAFVGGMIVEPTLGHELDRWVGPLVYLDFETVSFAIPRFHGTTPWSKIPVQYSAHCEDGAKHTHRFFLADDGSDPRQALAKSLVETCPGDGAIVAYHASFERSCIEGLVQAVPALRNELMQIHRRIVDLEPMVTNHLYHPGFKGSFSLKIVLPTLCPEVTYEGLTIADGSTAQLELARLLYDERPIPEVERLELRRALLDYCKLDTWAMVLLHRKLRKLAG
jgi:hypothetical protein